MDFVLEPSQPEDEDFLRRLNRLAYEEVVTAQFGGWDLQKQRTLFDHKWRTQKFSVIVRRGERVGGVSKVWSDTELTLLELLVLPSQQNAGIGTQVVRHLQQEAGERGLPLLLQVLHLNRARRLYERLDFRVIETTSTHYRMRWDTNAVANV